MYESTMSTRPVEMRWIPVADAHGRTRMESCWIPTDAAAAPHTSVSQAA